MCACVYGDFTRDLSMDCAITRVTPPEIADATHNSPLETHGGLDRQIMIAGDLLLTLSLIYHQFIIQENVCPAF